VAFIFALARAQSGPTGLWAGWCLDRSARAGCCGWGHS
jgi:hypothetical protein